MIVKRELRKMMPLIIISTLLICVITIPQILKYPESRQHLERLVAQDLASKSWLTRSAFPVFLGDQIIGPVFVRFNSVVVVFLAIGLIAGEIQFRTIRLLLSKPISRPKLYLAKTLAGVAGALIMDILPVLLIFLTSILIGQHLSIRQYVAVVISMFAGHYFVLGFSILQSSLFSDYIKPAFITMLLFIVLPSFTNRSSPLRAFSYESYVNVTDALKSCQISVFSLSLLFVLGTIFIMLGLLIFTKRSY